MNEILLFNGVHVKKYELCIKNFKNIIWRNKKMAKKVFAWSPVRKLMKDNGAEMVARDAVDALIDYLEKTAKNVTNKALEMTRHAGRKKLTLEDMGLAMKLM
ncbi:MAG: histone [Candidatus Hodarchaeota archaeon]